MSDPTARILVVEDEELLRSNIRETLDARGYDVQQAASGEEAMEILKGQQFDLVITDIRMGPIGGVELLTWVSADRPGTGVIVMTGFTSESQRYEILGRGGLRYLEKPFSLDFMATTVSEVLENRKANGFQATLSDIRLAELIQLHCLNRASGRLVARAGDSTGGEIYLSEGRFVHAMVGELSGQEALIALLRLPGGSCVFERDAVCSERSFPDVSGDHMLLDCLRQLDEREALESGILDAGYKDEPEEPDAFLLSKSDINQALNLLDDLDPTIPNVPVEPVEPAAPIEESPEDDASIDEESILETVLDETSHYPVASPADRRERDVRESTSELEPDLDFEFDGASEPSTGLASMQPDQRRYLEDFVQQLCVEYAAVLDKNLEPVGWTADRFLEDAESFKGLLARGSAVTGSRGELPVDVMEVGCDDFAFFAVRMNIGYLCCRGNDSVSVPKILEYFESTAV